MRKLPDLPGLLSLSCSLLQLGSTGLIRWAWPACVAGAGPLRACLHQSAQGVPGTGQAPCCPNNTVSLRHSYCKGRPAIILSFHLWLFTHLLLVMYCALLHAMYMLCVSTVWVLYLEGV